MDETRAVLGGPKDRVNLTFWVPLCVIDYFLLAPELSRLLCSVMPVVRHLDSCFCICMKPPPKVVPLLGALGPVGFR